MPVSSPMPPSAPPLRLRLLSGPLRACFLAALLMFPAVAASAGDGISEMERELAVERTCEDWQKVRRCADAEGRLEYECVAKSPMARFLAFFRSDEPEDDEVRVIRKAPAPASRVEGQAHEAAENRSSGGPTASKEDGEKAKGETESKAGDTRSASVSSKAATTSTTATTVTSSPAESRGDDGTDDRYRKVVVKKVEKDLPRCRDSR